MKKPDHIEPLADKLLNQLSSIPGCSEIVLGEYFALQHYLNYRTTHDVDAWWKTRATEAAARAIETTMRALAADEGLDFSKRAFGDTLSFELSRNRKRVFSFQIAVRTLELEPPVDSPWPPILIETLRDNVGAKMNALVDRGAPRDFSDIKHLVDAALMTKDACWTLWREKNPASNVGDAIKKVRMHLSSIAQRRPLALISDSAGRQRAEASRQWFDKVFLNHA